ncbi:hypothetical protein C0J52_17728 [Blattella germanica]|nr:hypothetical protein C0J52_17728 [Blattella germanica]
MVGKWTPEPPREPYNENLSTCGVDIVVIEQDSTESEDEDMAYSEYELLPQIPPDGTDSGIDDVDITENGDNVAGPSSNESAPCQLGDEASAAQTVQCKFEEAGQVELKEVWSAPSGGSNIEMGSEQVEQVRAAMANFALPSSSIPAWATSVPEEEWKQQLLDRIQRLQKRPEDEQSKT